MGFLKKNPTKRNKRLTVLGLMKLAGTRAHRVYPLVQSTLQPRAFQPHLFSPTKLSKVTELCRKPEPCSWVQSLTSSMNSLLPFPCVHMAVKQRAFQHCAALLQAGFWQSPDQAFCFPAFVQFVHHLGFKWVRGGFDMPLLIRAGEALKACFGAKLCL